MVTAARLHRGRAAAAACCRSEDVPHATVYTVRLRWEFRNVGDGRFTKRKKRGSAIGNEALQATLVCDKGVTRKSHTHKITQTTTSSENTPKSAVSPTKNHNNHNFHPRNSPLLNTPFHAPPDTPQPVFERIAHSSLSITSPNLNHIIHVLYCQDSEVRACLHPPALNDKSHCIIQTPPLDPFRIRGSATTTVSSCFSLSSRLPTLLLSCSHRDINYYSLHSPDHVYLSLVTP